MKLMYGVRLKSFTKNLIGVTFSKQKRLYSSRKGIILGIETSCDDTGCAIVDSEGTILGEALNSQHLIHLNNGGIIPPIAQDLHRKNIEKVVSDAIKSANISFNEIDAIAATVKPGLPLSLSIGIKYAKYLCRQHNKPLMPIHHMEAHALTSRMHDKSIDFPFLVLLISGGHCLLAVAQKVDKFLLLGQSIDDPPGEAFDKMARRMKLKNIPEYSELSGGQAVELAASKADNPLEFKFKIPLLQYRDCNFSFSGIKNQLLMHLIKEENEKKVGQNVTNCSLLFSGRFRQRRYFPDLPVDCVIPNINNLCAGFQLVMTRHLCHRVQRGMNYVSLKKIIPPDKQTLVVSGGAACNNFLTKGLQIVCDELGYKLVRPPPKLCTDNGVMIAWNGVERWKENIGIFTNFEDIDVEKTAPLGESLVEDVANANISCKWVKLSKLNYPQTKWDD